MTTGQRRRIEIAGDGTVRLVTERIPDLGTGEVLVRMLAAGVCGSDLHAMGGHHQTLQPPYYPGHEVVGIVEELAPDVTSVAVGDRVTAEPTLPCGACKMCTTGRSNICAHLQFFGCGWREGGMADLFAIAVDRLHKVPDSLSLECAALIEPLATPIHAVRLVSDMPRGAVAILGCGTIGLLTLVALRRAGAGRIVMTDVRADKRELALQYGADAVVDSAATAVVQQVRAELGETADLVFDCVSIQSTLRDAFAMVERGGAVVTVGVPAGALEVPGFWLQDRQIRLQGTATYLSEDFRIAAELLECRPELAALVTRRYPLQQAPEAFASARQGDQIKVVITAPGSLVQPTEEPA